MFVLLKEKLSKGYGRAGVQLNPAQEDNCKEGVLNEKDDYLGIGIIDSAGYS